MTNLPVHVALAILYREGKFLMQLRDDIPGIVYPGVWGLFGGHVEPGETPEIAVKRELIEEIGYEISEVSAFGWYCETNVIRHVFYARLTVDLDELVLNEGWDMGLITPEQIRYSQAYSQKAGMVRSLGRPHQHILLDFLEQKQEIL
ncbi:NUDIX hydrolase [Limnoraphis robusta]|uniref:NUDIX hydrolase n=1 Tax=Limnoraphis robusta CCNP1315 TaxID=3110306 RepID=A0ABU5U2P4_9CYAN|nr:NUDIX hydrolase [Limnoraphis robusta]MEA5521429.1 NUDIX hydrolase [Limnoraphis robusta CCNP1315]MEA5546488.1 NUDIX hydrolase [Limnoraphis robusta CCNP1324]